MPKWTPILALPNLDMHGSIQCTKAALVGRGDPRLHALVEEHPAFGDFLSRFKDQFGEQVHPSVFLLKMRAGKSYFTAEAVSAFRDLVALSIVPYARARRLIHLRPQPLSFSNVFAFYPWMMDKDYDDLVCFTPAVIGTHLLSAFNGQSFPEQSQTTVMEGDIDIPLAKALLTRWEERFSKTGGEWEDRALFRSLNMANEAARMPAITAATFYEFGRSLAIWVSAFEILTHPGKGEASIHTAFAAIDKVEWANKKLAQAKYSTGKKGTLRTLGCHVYERVYSLRNDFLHGNEVTADKLVIGKKGRQLIDYAACVYRLALTGFLGLTFSKDIPSVDDPKKFGRYVADHMAFEAPQKTYEEALEVFLEA